MNQIIQKIGKKLKKLSIIRSMGNEPTHKLFEIFVPAFKQTTFLKWNFEFDCETIERLREMYPYLEKLILNKRIFQCESHHEAINLH